MEIIDIQSFMSNFSEHVIYSYIKVPSVSPAHGIHFLYPAPDQSTGAVFLGTYSEWIDLNPDKDFQEGCTYIIVTDNESVPEAQPWLGRNINMVLVCSNIADTLHGIRAFFESFQNHTSKDGQQELIHFFQEISNPKEDSIKVFQLEDIYCRNCFKTRTQFPQFHSGSNKTAVLAFPRNKSLLLRKRMDSFLFPRGAGERTC